MYNYLVSLTAEAALTKEGLDISGLPCYNDTLRQPKPHGVSLILVFLLKLGKVENPSYVVMFKGGRKSLTYTKGKKFYICPTVF